MQVTFIWNLPIINSIKFDIRTDELHAENEGVVADWLASASINN